MSETEIVEGGLRTVKEAQAYTRLGRTTLYGLMERRELEFVKIGRRRLIPHRALVELAGRGLVARSEA
jgi:excisionase family DNA binding protein